MKKQNISTIALRGILLLMISMFNSCIKEEVFAKATVETNQVTAVTEATATCGGIITSDGGAPVTQRGICWNTSPNPTTANNKTSNGSGTGTFISNITGLTPGTTYYVRAYATNSVGTCYGNEVSFIKVALKGTVTDIDGNVYSTVKIGTQEWMAENLKTTKYNDGTSIPLVSDGTAWLYLTTPGYCFYNNDAANKNIYGALYNWYTVNTNKLAPTGWHVPTDAEWTTLTTYLTNNGYGDGYEGTDIAQSMASTSGWDSSPYNRAVGNDPASNNSSGFTGLPGGFRSSTWLFSSIGSIGLWWSSTEYSTTYAWSRDMYCGSGVVPKDHFHKRHGFSVRCVKD